MTASNSTASDASIGRWLDLAGVGPGQAICVAGPGGLEMTIALRRAGRHQIRCVRPPLAGADAASCDVLILTGRAEYMGGLAARAAALVRDGGAIIAWLERIEDDVAIRGALLVRGLEADTAAHQTAGGVMVIHRVRRDGGFDPTRAPDHRPGEGGKLLPFAPRRRRA